MRFWYSLTKIPMGVFQCNMTCGKIIVCLIGLALLVRLCPRDVNIFPNCVSFTAALGWIFKNMPVFGKIICTIVSLVT